MGRSGDRSHINAKPHPSKGPLGPVGSAPPDPTGLSTPSRGFLCPIGSDIVAPFPLASEHAGEPVALFGYQARHEIGEGVGRQPALLFLAGGNRLDYPTYFLQRIVQSYYPMYQ